MELNYEKIRIYKTVIFQEMYYREDNSADILKRHGDFILFQLQAGHRASNLSIKSPGKRKLPPLYFYRSMDSQGDSK